MPLTVDLRNQSFKQIKEEATSKDQKKLLEIVDDITTQFIYEQPRLIIDIENGKIPLNNLNNEIDKYIKANDITFPDTKSYNEVLNLVNSYLWGYGILQPYLDDPAISDVAVYSPDDVWIKKNGKRAKVNIEFASKDSLLKFVNLISIKNSGNLNANNAVIRLSDNKSIKDFKLRIVLSINPVNIKSPCIKIRKIPINKYTLDDLFKLNMLNEEMLEYFKNAMKAGLNIIWAGKGGSGKTTHLNACFEYIPETESCLVIQESDELDSKKGNVLWQQVVPKTGESDTEYSLEKLTIFGLLEDVDRMYIGESKGPESMDLMDAGFTGHVIGTTVHAPSSEQALEKIVFNMKKSGTNYKREDLLQMLNVIDVVIFMRDFKCVEVTEISGFDYVNNKLEFNPVFKYIFDKNTIDDIPKGSFIRVNKSCKKVQSKLDLISFNK